MKKFQQVQRFFIWMFIISGLVLVSLIQMSNFSPYAMAQTVPEEAQRIAQDHLNSLITKGLEDPEYFIKRLRLRFIGIDQIEDIGVVHLGKPYKRHWTTAEDIVSAIDFYDLSKYTLFVGYRFPIIHKGRYIGTIRVRRIENEELANNLNNELGTSYEVGSLILGGTGER